MIFLITRHNRLKDVRSRESYTEINSEEQDDPKHKGTYLYFPIVHPSGYQEEFVEPTKLVDLPRDVVVTRKRTTWISDTLQDAERHASPNVTFRERK
jgi:hypothetical protein